VFWLFGWYTVGHRMRTGFCGSGVTLCRSARSDIGAAALSDADPVASEPTSIPSRRSRSRPRRRCRASRGYPPGSGFTSHREFQLTQNSLPSQPDQLGDLCFDDLDPPLQRQSVVAAGRVEVEVEPVLPRLRLRHLLEPDRRAQPGRVEEPVVEGRPLAQPGTVVRVPCLGGGLLAVAADDEAGGGGVGDEPALVIGNLPSAVAVRFRTGGVTSAVRRSAPRAGGRTFRSAVGWQPVTAKGPGRHRTGRVARGT